MPSHAALLRPLLASILLASLAACSVGGIGDGNKPESVRIVRTSSVLDAARTDSFLCFRDQLQLITDFTNGGASNDTARAQWTSSNPAVIQVSNGDVFIPGSTTLVYQKGTLIPRAASTTPVTITAEFVGLTATYEVSAVRTPTEIRVEPLSQTMAFNTAGQIRAKAVIEGYTVDVTSQGEWSFVTPNTDVAVIGQFNGQLVSKGKVGDLQAQAKFSECPTGSGLETARTSDLKIRRVEGLTLTREFAQPNGDLIRGTTEAIKVVARFAGTAETQDVSTQFKTSFVRTPTDTTALLIGGLARNLVIAQSATTAPVTVAAEFTETFRADGATEDTNVKVTSDNSISFNVIERVLRGLSVTPSTATITALGNQQFNATGNFTDSSDANPTTQDITRHVGWSSSAPGVVFVASGVAASGVAISLKSVSSTVPVTLTARTTTVDGPDADTERDTVEGTATVDVVAP